MKRAPFLAVLAVLLLGAAPAFAADLKAATRAFRNADYARALHEFSAVVEQEPENAYALYVLGLMHERGLGLSASPAKAADFYLRAANLGRPEAQFKIAEYYETGQGVPRDMGKALRWYMSAAEHSDAPNAGEATLKVAQAFSEGEGITQNDLQAEIWLRRAANHGVTEAQYLLGELLFYISIPPHNNAEAYMWMRIAAALGHKKANKKRRLYAMFMTPNQLVEGEEMFFDLWPKFAPR